MDRAKGENKRAEKKRQIYSVMEACGLGADAAGQAAEALEEKGLLEDMEAFCRLEKGMTNRLFHFCCRGREYLIRVPGEGSEKLLDRKQEAMVYRALAGRDITDRYLYINPGSGIKITEYLSDAHTCDVEDMEEVRRCIRHLFHFHRMRLTGEAEFDVFRRLSDYESECGHDIAQSFPDYGDTKAAVLRLRALIDAAPTEKCLCHIDPVPDNFLIGPEKISLIDWEYAAVADPHMDIAMFCIYAGYDRARVDRVIDFYFSDGCPAMVRRKIYCYIAVCGLLWTVWCEIKKDSGVYFDAYEKIQYQYAKDYYGYAMAMWEPAKREVNHEREAEIKGAD